MVNSENRREKADVISLGVASGRFIYLRRSRSHGFNMLDGNSLRGYSIQAANEKYQSQAYQELDWWPSHMTEEIFFFRYYSTRTTLYQLNATLLLNYLPTNLVIEPNCRDSILSLEVTITNLAETRIKLSMYLSRSYRSHAVR
jgi:hypothetical protein